MATQTRNTRRPARGLTLTAIGHAAVWYQQQKEALAARPVGSVQACACCDTVYPVAGLARIESYEVYERASEVVSFNWDDLVCKFCREDFQADFGEPDTDVYHVFDTGIDPRD
jgi:hypothetical protein